MESIHNKFLTVIIPVYNAEKHIGHCIDSILSQSYPYINVICINDGSTDDSGRIIGEYEKKGASVKQIIKKNGGVSSARNDGIDHADTEYIAFVDADDYLDPDFAEKLMRNADGSDLILTGFKRVEDNGKLIEEYKCRSFIGNIDSFVSAMDDYLVPPILMSVCGKIYKKSIIQKNGVSFRTDISYGEDSLFTLDYLDHCEKICAVSSTEYNYRYSGSGSLSGKFIENKIDILLQINKRIIDIFELHNRRDTDSFEKASFCSAFVHYAGELYRSKLPYSEKKRIFRKKAAEHDAAALFSCKEQKTTGEKAVYLSLRTGCYLIIEISFRVYYAFFAEKSIRKL